MNLLSSLFLYSLILTGTTGKVDKQCEKPLFAFGIIADVQYSDAEPAGTRYYRNSSLKLQEAIDTFRKESVDFIINLGDLIDHDYDSYEKISGILNNSGIRTYHVQGNHDYSVEPSMKDKLPFSKAEKGYYSHILHGFRFIFLNGNEISTYANNDAGKTRDAESLLKEMKDRNEINAMEWNGGVGPEQLRWLKNQLNDASGKDEKVIIICHFPVFPQDAHNLLNSKEILKIIEKNPCVTAWFSGHNHAGSYGIMNKIHFVSFTGMVETERTNSYAIVDVYKNKMVIEGFGRETGRTLSY